MISSKTLPAILILIVATLSVYWQVTGFEFLTHWDDAAYVSHNPRVLEGFSFSGLAWSLTTFFSGNWHPVTWWSLMLDSEIQGTDAAGYHLTNLILHTFNGVLLYLFFARTTGRHLAALLVALLFLLHPLHVESVAWISERKDLLSTLFMLLVMLLYARHQKSGSMGTYLLMLVCYLLGLMSKVMLVTLPFVLLLLDYWPLAREGEAEQRFSLRQLATRLLEKWPLLLMAVGFCVIALVAQASRGAVSSIDGLGLIDRLGLALSSYTTYLQMTLLPLEQSFFYPLVGSPGAGAVVGSLLVLLLLGALAVWLFTRAPYLLVGYCWFLGTLVPVIGLVQIGLQQHADRYTYIPLIGLFAAFAYGLDRLLKPQAQGLGRAVYLGMIVVISLLAGAKSYYELGYWQNEERLFLRALEVTEDNFRVHEFLAEHYYARGDLASAQTHIERSLAINPNRATAHLTLGVIQIKLGKFELARKAFEYAWQLDDTAFKAPFNLGLLALQQGNPERARQLLQQSLALYDEYPETHLALANTHYMLGDYSASAAHNRQALALAPKSLEAHINLALAEEKLGRFAVALETYRRAVRIQPESSTVRLRMGRLHYRMGDYGGALEVAQAILQRQPDHRGAKQLAGEATSALRKGTGNR